LYITTYRNCGEADQQKVALSRRRGVEKKVCDSMAKYVSGNIVEAFCATSGKEVSTELNSIIMKEGTIK
jgi:hypothetical protein